MSGFKGPGLYTITASYVDKRLDLDDGKKEDGTKLQLFKPLDDDKYGPDQQFIIANVGRDEHVIINIKSGTYLTASDDNGQITANFISPLENKVRWKIHPARGAEGAYTINSVAYNGKVVDVSGSKTDDRTPVLTYPSGGSKNQQFILNRVL
ncbi:ricin B lectin domain-containing protein [Aspergillus avenaceus]|uniref:Ricin B lectin domain-containing protein n=1 Tax=Aspergillus avenaceus TaxID=36643 RepID=A0A5N6THL4_ASPAV|nr:ricin B lectin domain-containing protein [Aspergillus avenaceus]